MSEQTVLILVGSKSDMETMQESTKVLDEFGVSSRIAVASAHRTPELVSSVVGEAESAGTKVIIAAAGYAAHLAGAVAARTAMPVIGVPLDASSMGGIDSLLSTVQMPSGIPVATVTIGKAGAKNAAILAVQMLSIGDDALRRKLVEYRKKMAESVNRGL